MHNRRRHFPLWIFTSLSLLLPMTSAYALDFTDRHLIDRVWIVNDGVMGGVSQSRVRHEPEGMVFEGEVSLRNNGGFASMRSPAAFAVGTERLQLTVRGDGQRYKLVLRTEASTRAPLYQCDFIATPDWQTHRFMPADFRASFRGQAVNAPPLVFADVKELGILIADKQAGTFRVQVKAIQGESGSVR